MIKKIKILNLFKVCYMFIINVFICAGVSYAEDIIPASLNNNHLEVANGVCIVNGKQYIFDSGSRIYGGGPDWNGGSSCNNEITVYSGEFDYFNIIYGGYATHDNNYADTNKIIIKDGVLNSSFITGAQAEGWTTLKNNCVVIESGQIGCNVYGSRGGVEASYNTVNILGGKIGGVHKAMNSYLDSYVYGAESEYTNYNKVNIYNFPDLTCANLIGGRSDSDRSIGNELNIFTKGLSVKSIWRFQNINFYLPENITNGEAVFTIIGEVVNLNGVDISVTIPDNAYLHSGDRIYLLNDYCKSLGEVSITMDSNTKFHTISNKYRLSFSLENDRQNIVATVL